MSKYTSKTLKKQIKERQNKIQKETSRLFYRSILFTVLCFMLPPLKKKRDAYLNRMYSKIMTVDDEVGQLKNLLAAREEAMQSYKGYKKGLRSRSYAARQLELYKQLEEAPQANGYSPLESLEKGR